LRDERTPQRAFGSDANGIWMHVVLKARLRHDVRGDAERGQMRRPCDAVGEAPGRVGLEQIDDFPRQIVLAHISEAGVVDEVRGVAGVEQLQEV
jgi:hypothetical protein